MSQPPAASDTAARSLAHWSEAGRTEMDAFYAFARLDYSMLAGAMDWGALLARVAGRRDRLTLLDVACGSGKFPAALLAEADLDALDGVTVDYDLLDPSAFSLAEAAGELRRPFHEGSRLETTVETLHADAGPWDVVWATHALYALEPAAVDAAAARLARAIAPGGVGFVAQGAREGHYMRVDRAFLESGIQGQRTTPYTAVEDLAEALARAGTAPVTRRLTYEHVVPPAQSHLLEGYLQRCLFDDSLTLEQMLATPVLGPYLAGCRDPESDSFRFIHEVDCLVFGPEGVEPAWTAEH